MKKWFVNLSQSSSEALIFSNDYDRLTFGILPNQVCETIFPINDSKSSRLTCSFK